MKFNQKSGIPLVFGEVGLSEGYRCEAKVLEDIGETVNRCGHPENTVVPR